MQIEAINSPHYISLVRSVNPGLNKIEPVKPVERIPNSTQEVEKVSIDKSLNNFQSDDIKLDSGYASGIKGDLKNYFDLKRLMNLQKLDELGSNESRFYNEDENVIDTNKTGFILHVPEQDLEKMNNDKRMIENSQTKLKNYFIGNILPKNGNLINLSL